MRPRDQRAFHGMGVDFVVRNPPFALSLDGGDAFRFARLSGGASASMLTISGE